MFEGMRCHVGNLTAGLLLSVSLGLLADGQEPGLFSGHEEPVYTIAATPDGAQIVTGSFDHTLRLWDCSQQTSLKTMEGHTGLVLTTAISRDGARIASGATDNTIKLWDVPLSKPTGSIPAAKGPQHTVAVNQDGTVLAAGGDDKVIRLWNPVENKSIREITGPAAPITRLDLRRDDKQLATAEDSGIVRFFETAEGKPEGVIGAHDGAVTGLAYASNNTFLLTAGADGLVKKWPVKLPETRTITGHGGGITALRVSPNNARIASASDDKTVRIWNFSDGKELHSLAEHKDVVTALAFSANSTQLVTGGRDRIVRLFDANNGKLIKEFPAQAGAITAVDLRSNDQEIVASVAGQKDVKVYKAADATEAFTLTGHTGAVNCVVWTPNGASLVTGSQDGTVRIWNAADGKEQRKIAVEQPVTTLAVSINNAQVAVGCGDHAVRVYNLADGKLLSTFQGHTAAITAIEFTRDQQRVASTSDDGTTRTWDLKLQIPWQRFVHHEGAVRGLGFLTDSRTIITGGADKSIWIDQFSVQMAAPADEQGVNDLALASNTGSYATAGASGKVSTWNSSNGSQIRELPAHEGAALSVALSDNNQYVASGGADKRLLISNPGNSQLYLDIDTPAEVQRMAWSRDSTKLVVVGSDNVLRSYDPQRPNPQPPEPPSRDAAQSMTGHEAAVHGLAFAPDNRTLYSASLDGTVRSWSVAAASFSADLRGHSSQVYSVAFHPEGKTLASGSNDKTVRLWDLEKKSQIRTISTQDGAVYSVAFSPDGKQLLTGGADKSVRLIDVDTGRELRRFDGPEFAIYSVAFSSDGKTIAAGGVGLGQARRVYIWDVGNPAPVKVLEGHRGDVYRVQFSPSNDNRLVSIGYARTVHVWDIPSGKSLFSTTFSDVLYSGCYIGEGEQLVVTASDGNAHLVNLPAAAR